MVLTLTLNRICKGDRMLNLKPRPYDMRGNFVVSLAERPEWDVVLDDDGDETFANLVSKVTITVVSAVETATDTWTVTLSDDDSTVVEDLTKTGTVDIASSTQDGSNSDVYDCVLTDGALADVHDTNSAPIVGSFVYYLPGSPVNFVPAAPTWVHMTAAEFLKWM